MVYKSVQCASVTVSSREIYSINNMCSNGILKFFYLPKVILNLHLDSKFTGHFGILSLSLVYCL